MEGQALVEFALVLPVLLLLAFGIVLMAEIGVARVTLEHAAAEGARTVALTNDDTYARNAIDAAAVPLDRARVAIRITPPEGERPLDPRGSLLRVDLEYPVPLPLANIGLPSITVSGHAARIIEWAP